MQAAIEKRRKEMLSRHIGSVGHKPPNKVTDRMKAFVVQLERRFGGEVFGIGAVYKEEFEEDVARRYGLRLLGHNTLPKMDDLTVLAKHLPAFELLEHLNESRAFRLTEKGLAVAEAEKASQDA